MARMLFKNATGLSLGGVQIDQAEDGTFDIPEHLVAHAKQVGAKPAPEPEPEPEPESGDAPARRGKKAEA